MSLGPVSTDLSLAARQGAAPAQRWLLVLLVLLVAGGYWSVLLHGLGALWSYYGQYHYGWGIPFLCALLLWRRWKDRPSATAPGWPRAAVGAVVAAACLLLPTRLLHEASPVWRATAWLWTLEILVFTLAFVYAAGGKPWLRHFIFPICFFLVSVPWPYPVEKFLVERLTHFNVAGTVELLSWCGIMAVPHGNVIEVDTGRVGVDEACSGIRSFQVTLMLCLFFGEFYRVAAWRRVWLVALGFVLAVAFNIGRTLLLTGIASAKGMEAMASWHDLAGVIVLVGCFLSLWLAALVLRAQTGKGVPPQECGMASVGETEAPPSCLRGIQRVSWLLLGWLVVTEAGTELWYRLHERTISAQTTWVLRKPIECFDFKNVGLSDYVRQEFRADQQVQWRWQDPGGTRWQFFYFRWSPSTSLGRRVAAQRAKMHGPEGCLPMIGMTLHAYVGEVTVPFWGSNLALQQYEFSAEGERLDVFYGVYEDQTGTEVLANRRVAPASRVLAALSGSRNCGQRFLEIAVSGCANPDEARAVVARELSKVVRMKS